MNSFENIGFYAKKKKVNNVVKNEFIFVFSLASAIVKLDSDFIYRQMFFFIWRTFADCWYQLLWALHFDFQNKVRYDK